MSITRLNHAVLYVRNAKRTASFFVTHLGFVTAVESPGGVFLQCSSDSMNDHDVAFFTIGDDALDADALNDAAGEKAVGLYHLAWEVQTLGQLLEFRDKMKAAGALVGATNHGVSRSLYCKDPDGLEFELMWAVPPELHDPERDLPGITPLNLEADIERFGADTVGRQTS